MKELPSFRNLVASRYPTDLFPAMLVSGETRPVSLVYHTESFVVSHIPSPSRRVEGREEGIGGAIWVHKWLGDFVGLATRATRAIETDRVGGMFERMFSKSLEPLILLGFRWVTKQ